MSESVSERVVTFGVAQTSSDKAAVLRLRDEVYVRDQGRLTAVQDMAGTFDRYDQQAVYLLANDGTEAIGTIKLIADSPLGLPCDDSVDLASLRGPGRVLVEFGHLMTLPRVRNRSVAVGLMREALLYSVGRLHATHVLGDFFANELGDLHNFYTLLGFEAIGEPYPDHRFAGSPLSVVAYLDLAQAAARSGQSTGRSGELLRYFFHDYDQHAARS
jgi:predicted GNAT family N-acyltransferase